MSSSLRIKDLSSLKNVQQWLKHPVVWSGLASVAAHGFLFALLPLINTTALNENPPDTQRSVDLVELTPEEQQRLPDFPNEAPIELPPITQTPAQSSPNLFPALPPLSSDTLPPLSPSFTNPLPLPPFPIFPTLPPIARVPLQIPAPTLPPRPQISPTPSAQPSPSPTPSPQASNSPGAANPPTDSAQTPDNPAPDNPAPETQAPEAPAEAPPTPQERLLAQQRELREQLAFNPEGTSNGAFRESGLSWGQRISSELGDDWNDDARKNLDPDNVVELVGDYPKAACNRSGAVILGVVVDGEGKLVQEPVPPTILQSSGYQIFNQLALEAAAAHTFEATGKRLPYYVRVTFEPTRAGCPAGSVTQPQQAPPS